MRACRHTCHVCAYVCDRREREELEVVRIIVNISVHTYVKRKKIDTSKYPLPAANVRGLFDEIRALR